MDFGCSPENENRRDHSLEPAESGVYHRVRLFGCSPTEKQSMEAQS